MPNRKTLLEVLITPVVVAIVGIVGTYLITKQQNEYTKELREVEINKLQEQAVIDRELKIIEIFADKITSGEPNQKVAALQILKVIDGEMAIKLAEVTLKVTNENSIVAESAKDVISSMKSIGNSFPIIISFKSLNDAKKYVRENNKGLKYILTIFLSDNGFYAVTLGGYLSYKEAKIRINYALDNKLSDDAYVKTSTKLGKNLFYD
ncbi:SPOR domain-containing protein [Poseidonibacter lekithochrous]|uniref:SPOR domain-containing protein n=1 Tax=Poseidonibacter lekithochrous TaxID=1904463 RepID=UPI0008FC3FAB|nr:SPOR domain-containing protein [Poseidonibacter lekithochrous]QKJ23161.1 hypothetical protein ALEK_1897 [Poseidonibacter lekithochrous]